MIQQLQKQSNQFNVEQTTKADLGKDSQNVQSNVYKPLVLYLPVSGGKTHIKSAIGLTVGSKSYWGVKSYLGSCNHVFRTPESGEVARTS